MPRLGSEILQKAGDRIRELFRKKKVVGVDKEVTFDDVENIAMETNVGVYVEIMNNAGLLYEDLRVTTPWNVKDVYEFFESGDDNLFDWMRRKIAEEKTGASWLVEERSKWATANMRVPGKSAGGAGDVIKAQVTRMRETGLQYSPIDSRTQAIARITTLLQELVAKDLAPIAQTATLDSHQIDLFMLNHNIGGPGDVREEDVKEFFAPLYKSQLRNAGRRV